MKKILLLLLVVTFWPGSAQTSHATALPDLLQHTRFIAYTPRSFSITGGKIRAATEAGIRR